MRDGCSLRQDLDAALRELAASAELHRQAAADVQLLARAYVAELEARERLQREAEQAFLRSEQQEQASCSRAEEEMAEVAAARQQLDLDLLRSDELAAVRQERQERLDARHAEVARDQERVCLELAEVEQERQRLADARDEFEAERREWRALPAPSQQAARTPQRAGPEPGGAPEEREVRSPRLLQS